MLWSIQMTMSSTQLAVWSLEGVHVIARCSTSPSRLNYDTQDIPKQTGVPNPAAYFTLNLSLT